MQFAYSADVPSSTAAKDGSPTASVKDVYSNLRYPTWTYDSKQLAWLRTHESGEDLDSHGNQLSATNVISMIVDIDWRYDCIPKTLMEGAGEVHVSTAGKTVTATWNKESQTAPIRLVDQGRHNTACAGQYVGSARAGRHRICHDNSAVLEVNETCAARERKIGRSRTCTRRCRVPILS